MTHRSLKNLLNQPAAIAPHKLTIKNKLIVRSSLAWENLNNDIATLTQDLHRLAQSRILS
jgi:hypothetical protein